MRVYRTWAVAAATCVVVGCGAESPPFASMDLRDVLRAEPSALAASAELTTLAQRFETSRTTAGALVTVQAAADATPESVARAVDEARERTGDDALVASRVEGSLALPFTEAVADDARPDEALTVDGEAPSTTASIEASALRSRAGSVVLALRRASGASHVVRVTGWPVGVIAVGDAVYVNAAWLVAMAPMVDAPTSVVPSAPPPSPPSAPTSVFTNRGGGSSDAGMSGGSDAGTSSSGSGSGCSGSGSNCSSSCNTCDSCNSDCSRCNRCSNGRCTAAPAPAPASPGFVFTRALAMLAPLALLLFAGRRGR
ncbi:MAG: hypothetical protein R3A52_07265 [Polyangiales bacterium]